MMNEKQISLALWGAFCAGCIVGGTVISKRTQKTINEHLVIISGLTNACQKALDNNMDAEQLGELLETELAFIEQVTESD
jgi:hypothetical protein